MDLTPDVLRGIEFRKKGRGYDVDDVDAFRQNVEIWVGEVQARLREATSKLDEAETRAREAEERSRTTVEGDETIQRTLLLAQRTADAAVKEAEETAGRKVADAEAEAERLVSEARSHRERAIAEAESEVREAIDLKRAELLDELTTLERVRDALTADVAALEVHIEGQHNRIQDARDMLGVLLEQPLAPAETPMLSGVEVPEPAIHSDLLPEPEPELEPPAVEVAAAPAPFDLEAADDVVEPDEPAAEEVDPWSTPPVESVFGEPASGPDTAVTAAGEEAWSAASEDAWAETPPPPPPPPGVEVDEAAWADAPPPPPPPPPDFELPGETAATEPGADGGSGTFGGLSGPAVPEQLPELDDQAEEDNPWLAELADQETGAEDGGRSRFGRRR